jgi:putative hydrolase
MEEIAMQDIMDLHTHTIASGHAYNTIYEMARGAADHGVKLLGITEHTPKMPGSCHEFYFLNFKVVPRELYGVRLMLGAELNIMDFDGTVDLPPSYLSRLDLAIASLHTPCIRSGTAQQNTRAYLNVMKNPAVRIIGHPDDGRYPTDYKALVYAAKENHVLLEVNNTSLSPESSREGAYENYLEMLDWCKQYQAPIIIDSDAHCEIDVGNHVYAHRLLEEVQFPQELIVNDSLEKAAAFLPWLAERLSSEAQAHD